MVFSLFVALRLLLIASVVIGLYQSSPIGHDTTAISISVSYGQTASCQADCQRAWSWRAIAAHTIILPPIRRSGLSAHAISYHARVLAISHASQVATIHALYISRKIDATPAHASKSRVMSLSRRVTYGRPCVLVRGGQRSVRSLPGLLRRTVGDRRGSRAPPPPPHPPPMRPASCCPRGHRPPRTGPAYSFAIPASVTMKPRSSSVTIPRRNAVFGCKPDEDEDARRMQRFCRAGGGVADADGGEMTVRALECLPRRYVAAR